MAFDFKELAVKIANLAALPGSENCWAMVMACAPDSGDCPNTQGTAKPIRVQAFDVPAEPVSKLDIEILKDELAKQLMILGGKARELEAHSEKEKGEQR